MKIMLGTVVVVVGFALLMAGWSVGGRLMSEKSDYALFEGIAVRALLAGAVISGSVWAVRKIMASGSVKDVKGSDGK
jgi:hypothetical protein